MADEETAVCCRCQEDFPVAKEPSTWQMGKMRPLKFAPKYVRDRYGSFLAEELRKAYLCGNCYFDLKDDQDDRMGR